MIKEYARNLGEVDKTDNRILYEYLLLVATAYGMFFDVTNSIRRYYINNFEDGQNQDALDIFFSKYPLPRQYAIGKSPHFLPFPFSSVPEKISLTYSHVRLENPTSEKRDQNNPEHCFRFHF